MSKILRWTGRVLFAVGVIGLLACGLFLAWFSSQRDEELRAMELRSRMVTTSVGEIEVVTSGPDDGPAILVLHGTPGGYDQALAIGKSIAASEDLVVAPSRPGYLRTPFVNGFLFSEQADAMAALLDSLNIPDAAIVGFGAGAIVGAEMGIRHPGRVRGLVMISPPTVPLPALVSGTFAGINYLGAQVMAGLGGDLGAFTVVRDWDSDPRKSTERVLSMDTTRDGVASTSEAIMDDPAQRELMQSLIKSVYPLSPRELGARNDLLHLRHPQPIDFASINCPILVLSGALDQAREVVKPAIIVDTAPDAKSEIIAGAGSLVWFGPGASGVARTIREFMQNLPPPLPAE